MNKAVNKKSILIVASTVLLLGLFISGSAIIVPSNIQNKAISEQGFTNQPLYSALLARAKADGTVPIIVGLNIPFQPEGYLSESAVSQQRVTIARAQDDLLKALSDYHIQGVKTYAYIPYLAMTVDEAALTALYSMPQVSHVEADLTLVPTSAEMDSGTTNGVALIKADQAWAMGYDGTGQEIAILDTGVLSSHPFLSGKVDTAVGACYSTSTGQNISTCNSDGAGEPAKCLDQLCDISWHGTHVAGIAAGLNGPSGLNGVAKGANIISVNVFTWTPSGKIAWSSDVVSALNYIYGLRTSHNIAAVNLSLATLTEDSTLYSSSCSSYASFTSIVSSLKSADIATIASAGKESGASGSSTGISFPACVPNVVSVGVTTLSDTVPSYTNSNSLLSLWAPGDNIYSSVTNGACGVNSYCAKSGSSMAAPHLSGAWALMRQKKPGLTGSIVNDFLTAFQSTGVSITDSRNGLARKRIQVDTALTYIGPASPSLISPSGSITTHPPTFQWSRVAGASHYHLYVRQGATIVVDNSTITPTDASCVSSGPCSYTPSGATWNYGDYSWAMQTQSDAAGWGNWSGVTTFTITIPGTTLSSPSGSSTNWKPTYTWSEVTEATQYYLYVYNSSTTPISQWYTVGSGGLSCGSGTCTITPDVELGSGSYTWEVRTKSGSGSVGPWSNTLSFNTPGGASSVTTLNSPTGSITTFTPEYSWDEPAGAPVTKYYLYVYNSTTTAISQWYTVGQGGLVCSGGSCTITPSVELGGGSYSWMVRAGNPSGIAPGWSPIYNFITPSVPNNVTTLNAPSGSISTWTPQYSWIAPVSGGGYGPATKYYLYVYNSTSTVISQWFTQADGLDCGSGTCYLTPSVTLGVGTYSWMVRAGNPAGMSSSWSGTLSFTTPSNIPGAATLVSPSGSSADWQPTYTWNEPAGPATATKYYLYVYNSVGAVISQWYIVGQGGLSCSSGTCTITPNVTLGAGSYTWMVRSYNANGMGPWSGLLSFSTPPPPNSVVTLNAPTGTSSDWSPQYSWTAPASGGGFGPATKYYLYVYSGSTVAVSQWFTQADGLDCSSGTCYLTPNVTLGGGTYTWMVRSGNPSGNGPAWSGTLSFTTPGAPDTAVNLDAVHGSNPTDPWNPTYRWDPATRATKYYLYIYKGSTVVFSNWVTPECSPKCTITPNAPLGAGPYSWMVRSGNPSGMGSWSSVATYATPDAPTLAPTLVAPISYHQPADVDKHRPKYIWSKDTSGATVTKYYVYVYSGSTVYISTWVNVTDLTDEGSNYSYNPESPSLPSGTYSWMIRPGNPSGMAPWSTEEHFVVP